MDEHRINLFGENSVLGRSIVVEGNTDGVVACGNIFAEPFGVNQAGLFDA